MDTVIRTHELTKHFRHPLFSWVVRAKAVNNLSIEVPKGQVYGLLGPNGSGKSTTIKLILGLLTPTSGEVRIFGKPPQDQQVKSRIGYLPEESYLYGTLNAEETLDFYARLFQLDRVERKRRVRQLLDKVGLGHVINRPVGEFSKGMQRRIGLAQCLINDPELIILDEPTTGLDPIGTREIKDLIKDLKSRGKTILLCSHLLGEIEDICDRACILYGGQVKSEGPLDKLITDEKRTQITGNLSPETIQKIEALIKAEQGEDAVFTVAPAQKKLEHLFLETVQQARKTSDQTSGARGTDNTKLDFLSGNAPPKKESILSELTATETAKPETESTAKPVSTNAESNNAKLEALMDKPDTPNTPTEPPIKSASAMDAKEATEAPAKNVDRKLLDQLVTGDNE